MARTAPLSYTDHFHDGLRINPSYDEMLGTVRKPLNIPLPDRSSKWYALSLYRALILDAKAAHNDYQHSLLDYRHSGAELPESAAQVYSSPAGEDDVWHEIERQNQRMEEQHAYEAAFDAMNAEHQAQTARFGIVSSRAMDPT